MEHTEIDRTGKLSIPRSRGALSGFLLVILGAWGALIPFIGPYFDFAYTPGQQWVWTAVRGWLEVLPGIATVAGGLLLIASRDRASAVLGGWLAVLGGAWFVVGPAFAPVLRIGTVGDPVASAQLKRAWLEVAYFYGLGALIVFIGGAVLARLVARLARDIRPIEAHEHDEPGGPAAPAEPVESAPVAEASPESTEQPEAPSDAEARHGLRGLFHRQRAGATTGHRE
ncbi:hypothetical protein [Mycobacterium sp. HUMS_1102779]|uniref:hypothetical protein n=1 Tax=Mycobacterium sp. HUMS_1102779 TaxID=3383487 RepID=UPI00389B2200